MHLDLEILIKKQANLFPRSISQISKRSNCKFGLLSIAHCKHVVRTYKNMLKERQVHIICRYSSPILCIIVSIHHFLNCRNRVSHIFEVNPIVTLGRDSVND